MHTVPPTDGVTPFHTRCRGSCLLSPGARGESRTDLACVDAMPEEELEAAIASDPDWRDVPRDWYEAEPFFPRGPSGR